MAFISGLGCLLIVVLLIAMPLIAISCINFLFNLSIPHTVEKWFAMLLLIWIFGAARQSK
jgi:hypothetical protein